MMDRRLLQAAISGDAAEMNHLAVHEQGILLGITPQGNNCLYIAAIHGHEGFCKDVLILDLQQSLTLLTATNEDGETPLLTAVTRGHGSSASVLLKFCRDQQLSETILKQDKCGFNALHHSVFRGHRKLALELIEAEPVLSKAVNKCYESPMFIAVMRGYRDVLEKLLDIPDSADVGPHGCNALHAAVTSGNADGSPLLCTAASQGNVGVARELLRHCPDPPLCDATGSTCLHTAVSSVQENFVRFVLGSPQLQHIVNLPDNKGETALHIANRIMPACEGQKKKTMTSIVAVLQFYPSNRCIHAQPFTSGMEQLLEAAACGHVAEMRHLYQHVPGVLLGTTPQGNTCLHIAAIHGHHVFCMEVQALKPSLLAAVNSDGETPLIAAVTSGSVSAVASVLLRCCRDQQLSEAILKQDKRGCNALHHAIRSGHRELALELIQAEPALSQAVNQYGESPMSIAVMRNYEDVFDDLWEIPDSAHGGACGMNALHAAVRNNNTGIAKKIMQTRPALATEENQSGYTPMMLAVLWDKIGVLRVLLEQDRSLGCIVSSRGVPLLNSAACRGRVGVARELLRHCPDVGYIQENNGRTCLHEAVLAGQMKFLQFVLGSPQLKKHINMQDKDGDTALHMAVNKCNPKMVAALLRQPDIDSTMLNKNW